VRSGDIFACPADDRKRAHAILNTGNAELRYLVVSTKLSPEIAEYPDSGTFGVLAQFADESGGEPRMFYYIDREGEGLDYWEGE
jgi:uncharacterized cupin superfamily protein